MSSLILDHTLSSSVFSVMGEECEGKILGSPEAQVVQTKLQLSMKSPLLVCCFPSAGVIGTIAANTMIEQFEMEEVAHVRSRYMPSAAVFLDGRLRHPFRIYVDWATTMGVKEAVILDGIPVQGIPTDRKVLFAAEEEKIAELEEDEEMEILKKGIITGIAGSILSETLCRDMVGFALLTPAIPMMPDPEGAIQVLKALNRLYDVGVEVSELMESAEQIRKKMEEVAQQVDGIRRQQPGPSRGGYERMYA
jgi:uncharacterized protein